MGCFRGEQLFIGVRNDTADGLAVARGYNANNLFSTAADGRGLYSVVRAPAATLTLYRNGVFQNAINGGPNTPPDLSLWLGGLHYLAQPNDMFGPTTRRCAGAFVTTHLSQAETSALYNAVQAFNTALNRAV